MSPTTDPAHISQFFVMAVSPIIAWHAQTKSVKDQIGFFFIKLKVLSQSTGA